MNRPPNPYKREADLLESAAATCAGYGFYGTANSLYSIEAELRRRGRVEVELMMRERPQQDRSKPWSPEELRHARDAARRGRFQQEEE